MEYKTLGELAAGSGVKYQTIIARLHILKVPHVRRGRFIFVHRRFADKLVQPKGFYRYGRKQ